MKASRKERCEQGGCARPCSGLNSADENNVGRTLTFASSCGASSAFFPFQASNISHSFFPSSSSSSLLLLLLLRGQKEEKKTTARSRQQQRRAWYGAGAHGGRVNTTACMHARQTCSTPRQPLPAPPTRATGPAVSVVKPKGQ